MQLRRVLPIAVMVLSATAVSCRAGRHTALRARTWLIGFRHNPAGGSKVVDRFEPMSVDVIKEAARRNGIRLRWVWAPEGPDRALSARKVDLWPLFSIRPERGR